MFKDHFSARSEDYREFRPLYPGKLFGYLGTWSAVPRFEQRTGKNPIEMVGDSLLAAWADPNTSRPVEWPLALRVGRIRKAH